MPFDPSRLYTQLLNTGLQAKNNPLYQVIYSLIAVVAQVANTVNTPTSGGGGSTNVIEQNITNVISMLNDEGDSDTDDDLAAPFSIATSVGGSKGDLQYNKGGSLGGSVLKQTLIDLIEQRRGVNPQETRWYKDDNGANNAYIRLASDILDFFNENAFTFSTVNSGADAVNGIQLRSAGSISMNIPGAFPALVLYHDPTSNGGISLIPNGSGFIGIIACDQSGSLMLTTGGFAVNVMHEVTPTSTKGILFGRGATGSDFTRRYLGFDSTNDRVTIGDLHSVCFIPDSSTSGTVANLPAAPPKGSILYVTNALAPVIGAAVAGGGAAFALVCWNGAAWNVIGV